MVKGYTVHWLHNGQSACGTKPRMFMGKIGISANLSHVTCPKCIRHAQMSADELANVKRRLQP